MDQILKFLPTVWSAKIYTSCLETRMIVGSQEKASTKDGSRNFSKIFKNPSKQLRTMFTKIFRPENFPSGPCLNLREPIIILLPLFIALIVGGNSYVAILSILHNFWLFLVSWQL